MPHYARRKDNGHDAIVKGLTAKYISVVPMPDPGDILCFGLHAVRLIRIFVPMEIKTKRADKAGGDHGLTKKQAATRAAGVPIPVVHSLAEALDLFGLKE